jgi:thiamine biosynthesis lipoprotein
MGTDVRVTVVDGAPDLARRARRRIEALEARWSRFYGDSEVSAINMRAGEPVVVSTDTRLLVRRAVDAWRLTDGAFDPTVLGPLVRAGYDRSFDVTAPFTHDGVSDLGMGADGIEITDRSVRCRTGTGFDPGGLGKGLAADIVAEELRVAGAKGACVDIGGDLRMFGTAPDGGDWRIAIEHPWSAVPVTRVALRGGAVATSTTLRRRWHVGGAPRHHLIDPATGRSTTSTLVFATVVAGEAWAAEALAKALVIRGEPDPFALLDQTGAEALVVDQFGRVTTSFGLAEFTDHAAVPRSVVAVGA